MTIIRLVTKGTVEESILQLQQQKKTLDSKVLDDSAVSRRSGRPDKARAATGAKAAAGEGRAADDADDAAGAVEEGADSKLDLHMMRSIIEQALAATREG